jgi:hypothetical protein
MFHSPLNINTSLNHIEIQDRLGQHNSGYTHIHRRTFVTHLHTQTTSTSPSITQTHPPKMPSATPVRTMMRSLARNMVEPHPFARSPVTMAPHPWRAGDLGKRLLRTSAVYVLSLHTPIIHLAYAVPRFFPFYAVILGWPLGAAAFYNGRM